MLAVVTGGKLNTTQFQGKRFILNDAFDFSEHLTSTLVFF